ncbi:MAG: phage tail sheath family protein [Deltaproteobacteria bacterium]|nr:phage tail sheath family protein [Deltaproteobacteria bacterium]
MAVESFAVPGVPGVYRQARQRVAELPRVRTDVAGFVGVAGPNRIGEVVRVDDWRSFELAFLRDELGHAIAPPAGAMLADAVRAFFANGGARCWIVNVAERIDALAPEELLATMLGLRDRTGLEVLLLKSEVAIVGMPELDAIIASEEEIERELPPLAENGVFVCCPAIRPGRSTVATQRTFGRPLFDEEQLEFAQRYLIERCGRVKWRVFLVLAPPRGKTAGDALRWRAAIARNVADTDCAALYWPWLRVQDRPGDPVRLQSPVGHVIGVFARRDLLRGPHVPPANETLIDVVGLESAVDDAINEQVYDAGINVIRGFPGHGIQIWGARTLRWSVSPDALGWVNVRRCLSSIERNVERLGQAAVFEPNLPLLQLQVASAITGHLLDVLASGALEAEEPEDAFFVHCDTAENPPSVTDAGQLICKVGVAIAAPAEFIVFRVGRREGVVELQEVA